MTEIKALFRQSSHYFIGRLIIMAAGFISFPILTRIFSVSDYGVLSLITTTILIATAFAKVGFPESIVRFYKESQTTNNPAVFYQTVFLSSVIIAGIVSLLFGLIVQLLPNRFFNMDMRNLLTFLSVLIFIGSEITIFTSFLRAEQRTKLYNLLAIIYRYGSLVLGIFFVFFFIKGLYGFYVGLIIAGTIKLAYLFYIYRERLITSFKNFSRDIFKDCAVFGFPLLLAEIGHLVLNYADRYLVQLYLNSAALGLYTAGYNLATYATEIIIYPLNNAMTPIYMNILVQKGEQETKEFFTRALRYFLLIITPITFGFIAVGKDLIAFLASYKYLDAYVVIPYVIIGQSIYACSLILNNGLFIKKKTHIVTNVILVTCLLNVGINIILIPHFGILGAAQATLISNVFYTFTITYYAFKELSFRIDYSRIILYIAIAMVMFLLIKDIDGGSPLRNLFIKIPVGAIFYALFIMIFDRDVRRIVLKMKDKFKTVNLKMPTR